jgi:crotonobetainyl-CoA:carnitine CoA-transferase CaiB-like acyl-CoA transferase
LGRLDFLDIARGEPGPSQRQLIDYFSALFATKTRAEWETLLTPLDLCWAPVRTLKDAFGDANAAARGMLLRDAAGNPQIGPAIKFANEPAQLKFDLPDYDPEARPHW